MNPFYVGYDVLVTIYWGFLDILSLKYFCLEPFQMAIDAGIHFSSSFLPSILLGTFLYIADN